MCQENFDGDDATECIQDQRVGFNFPDSNTILLFVSLFRYQNLSDAGINDRCIVGLIRIGNDFSNGKTGIGFRFATTRAFYREDAKADEKALFLVPFKVE